MNLYLITQDKNTGRGTYESAIVAAKDEDAASRIHPSGCHYSDDFGWSNVAYDVWAKTYRHVDVKLIGRSIDDDFSGVILSSFDGI